MIKEPAQVLVPILKKLVKKIGGRVLVEPQWKIVGQIIFKNGRKRYFRYSSLDLNTLAASDVSKDKDYANFFMKKMGYPTIIGKTFFSKIWGETIGSNRDIHAAYAYAVKLGFPVFVKPNSGSQGLGVAKVYNKSEFYQAMRSIFLHDKVALVQRIVEGKDYRIVVLDNKIISAYQRIPLNIIGDSKSTVLQLLRRKQKDFIKFGRDTRIKLDDARIFQKLKRQELSMQSVVRKNEQIFLLDNANLSSGGDSIDVTKLMHPKFRKLAIQLTKDMGLRLCGVDLMIDGDIKYAPKKYWILETNAAPGLDHYVKMGRSQQKIVEDMYLKILKAMQ